MRVGVCEERWATDLSRGQESVPIPVARSPLHNGDWHALLASRQVGDHACQHRRADGAPRLTYAGCSCEVGRVKDVHAETKGIRGVLRGAGVLPHYGTLSPVLAGRHITQL